MAVTPNKPEKDQSPPSGAKSDFAAKASGLMGSFTGMMTENNNLATLSAYLPTDMVGGSIPYVPGSEDEGVWNAAAQACGTERVHYCYTIHEGRCWYLATPSSSLASNPDSWCPLAAALPGNSEHWDKETVYLYEQEGAAGALRWDQETGRMQVFLGAARTILPRIQSMEANFVTINPETADPVPWRNRALMQEKLSRMTVRILLFSGMAVTVLSLMIWVGSYIMASIIHPQLQEARRITTKATNNLLIEATNAMQSNTTVQMARVQQLLDTLSSLGGVLLRYELKKNGHVEWEALVPAAVQNNAPQLHAVAIGMEDGRVRIRGTR